MHPVHRQHARAIADRIVGHIRTPQGPFAMNATLRQRMQARADADGQSYADVLETVHSIFEECGSDTTTALREMDSYLDRILGSRWNPIG